MSLYSAGGGALLGTFFSGDIERGGVFEEEARRPRDDSGDKDMSLL